MHYSDACDAHAIIDNLLSSIDVDRYHSKYPQCRLASLKMSSRIRLKWFGFLTKTLSVLAFSTYKFSAKFPWYRHHGIWLTGHWMTDAINKKIRKRHRYAICCNHRCHGVFFWLSFFRKLGLQMPIVSWEMMMPTTVTDTLNQQGHGPWGSDQQAYDTDCSDIQVAKGEHWQTQCHWQRRRGWIRGKWCSEKKWSQIRRKE